MKKALLLAFIAILISGCGTTACRQVVIPPVPAPKVEIYGTPPSARAVWIPGYWSWRGPRRGYIWVPGHWKKN